MAESKSGGESMEGKKVEGGFAAAFKDFLAGAAGGVAMTFTGHPFDTVKVRLQTQATPKVGELPHFNGTVDAFVKTFRMEGVRGLYKGVTSPLIGVTIMNAAAFFSYGQVSAKQGLAAGFLAGGFIGLVESPTDLFKSKMQVQYRLLAEGKPAKYTGVFDCATKIMRQHGIRGVSQGLGATLLRDMPANGLYFGVYEWWRVKFSKPGKAPSAFTVFMAGGAGGVSYWIGTFPTDVIKSRMQTDDIVKSLRRYRNIPHCVTELYKEGGIRIFYRGFVPCLLRSFPSNAVTFLVYDMTRRLLSGTLL